MSRFHRRRSAYYSRNQSYSRSLNAENAEADGRLPRTRAAKHLLHHGDTAETSQKIGLLNAVEELEKNINGITDADLISDRDEIGQPYAGYTDAQYHRLRA